MENILLIWDIDGTLIDCKGLGRKAMDKAFLNLYRKEKAFKDVSMAGRLDFQIVKNAFEINKILDNNIVGFFDKYEEMLKEELKDNTSSRILPGIDEILEITSSEENLYHILGTGNCEKGARLKLSHLGLDKYFHIGGFGDEDIERWEAIEKAIGKAKDFYEIDFEKKNIYVIGDTPFDVECGKILGVRTVAVATGRYSYEELSRCKPDYIFYNFEVFEDFLSIIRKLEK
ncbi:HAD family hydrolase [Maledivibacter halophilus]|uniref:Phosphoglycolate phosphatase, HAD superfamily n=1 Tax=Maledivibacter halophilus TaxID=36842 RepID=A0A1T5M7W5_9FIRM|nr:HAD hydrolase-like protein [Maledivibacter halophilus]SKC84104.1 Phosphoglycolate phosphatase, HAD superfamily [Maledivibacter halophilus]